MELISQTFLQNPLFKSFWCCGRNIPVESIHPFHHLYLCSHFSSSLDAWFISIGKLINNLVIIFVSVFFMQMSPFFIYVFLYSRTHSQFPNCGEINRTFGWIYRLFYCLTNAIGMHMSYTGRWTLVVSDLYGVWYSKRLWTGTKASHLFSRIKRLSLYSKYRAQWS